MERPLTDCPNYFAWLFASSEYVYYMVREVLYVNHEDHEVFDAPYKTILDRLFANSNFGNKQKEDILFFAKIRHLMIHKGFPNPNLAPTMQARALASGIVFDNQEVWRVTHLVRDPKNFSQLKATLTSVIADLSSVQKEFVHKFGSMMVCGPSGEQPGT